MASKYSKYGILSVVVTIILVLDQYTKHLVHSRFRWGESLPIFDEFFALTYVRNTGAAFGLFQKAPAILREPFFIAVPIIAMFVIVVLFIRLSRDQKMTAMALSLILSGAVGNLIDRLRFGFVIDFLDFHWKEVYHWPAFNVADSAIVIGVSLIFLLSLGKGKGCVAEVNSGLTESKKISTNS
ncbi:MAG: signal peptidase II [Deltaproteobacteria bacterium]|nr:signal peptidase II [Deltaproteobacteria bacterium]